MSISRNSQKNKKSKENVFVDSSEDSTPESPAIKVKHRETKTNPDPLYYHPDAHPTLGIFFKQKSRELEKELRSSGELAVKDDVGTEKVAVKKAGL